MSRRLEVELTSKREDGTWTWRAAGARQPKGVVDASVLYPDARVGDVVKAEAEVDVDGITLTSVTPPPTRSAEELASRIELVGQPEEFTPVTSSLLPKHERPRPERGARRDSDRRDRPAGDRGPRPGGDRAGGRPGPDRANPSRPDRPGVARSGRPDGGPGDRGRTDRSPAPRGDRPDRPQQASRPPKDRDRESGDATPTKPRPKRLNPANVHRAAALDSLPPEQRAIAEQVLRGGIPAVRRALDEQNARAKAEGQPEIKADALVQLAEELLPGLKAADWRDRAEAAVADVDEIGLRDLRSVVAGSDVARDDESRTLASTLRGALERRLNASRDAWAAEITTALEENRLVRALRVSARPPDPSFRFPAEVAARLSEAAGLALASDVAADRWGAVLEAVAASPVRRAVKPAGLPAEPTEAVMKLANQLAGQVPALAPLLGIKMPPPPGPVRRAGPPGTRPIPLVRSRRHRRPLPPPPRLPKRRRWPP